MKIKIRYFGRFVIETDKFSEELKIDKRITVRDLISILKKKYPKLEGEEIEVSVNGRYTGEDEEIKSKEISVFPIISGG